MAFCLNHVQFLAWTLVAAAALAGCESGPASAATGNDTASADVASDTVAAGADTAAADVAADTSGDVTATKDYKDMTSQEKSMFMAQTVMPLMVQLVKKADPSKGGYVCAQCHGVTGPDIGFKMPNGVIPLDPKKLPPVGTSPLVDAMYKEITPQIAKLLGLSPYDPATGKGFGCFSCHGIKK
ncbi:MAG: hypothetical protein HY902_00220 [Deltaproteobacteria bacterium]|nr:hypothetical protein [Deltaproteobacteria bacterium]